MPGTDVATNNIVTSVAGTFSARLGDAETRNLGRATAQIPLRDCDLEFRNNPIDCIGDTLGGPAEGVVDSIADLAGTDAYVPQDSTCVQR